MLLLAIFLVPLLIRAIVYYAGERAGSWYDADWSSARLLPVAASDPEPRILVFSARTGRWKGIFCGSQLGRAQAGERQELQPLRPHWLWPAPPRQRLGARRALVRQYAADGRGHPGARCRCRYSENPRGDRGLSVRAARRLSSVAGPQQQHLRRQRAPRRARAR